MPKPATKKSNAYGRTYLENVTLNLGAVNVIGNLVSPVATNSKKAEAFFMLCPGCGADSPSRVNQGYSCDHGHGPFSVSEIPLRGKEDGDEIVVVSKEEIDAAKESAHTKLLLELHVHDAEQVEKRAFPVDKPYVFWPHEASAKAASIFKEMVDEAGKCNGKSLVGMLNTGRDEKLIRVQTWNGMIVLQTICRPEDAKDFPEYPVPAADEKLLGLAKTLVDGQVEEFDPDDYRKTSRERLGLLVDAAKRGETAPIESIAVPAPKEDDVEAMLLASLAALGNK